MIQPQNNNRNAETEMSELKGRVQQQRGQAQTSHQNGKHQLLVIPQGNPSTAPPPPPPQLKLQVSPPFLLKLPSVKGDTRIPQKAVVPSASLICSSFPSVLF